MDNQKSGLSIGTSSIVLIFVLLCMLTFSVLSLVSAQANLRLSRKSADRTTDYYAAETQANDILISLNEVISRHLDSPNATAFYRRVQRETEKIDGIAFMDDNRLSYQVPLGTEQMLYVALTLSFDPLPNGSHYQITAWNTISSYDWNPDDTLPVLIPNAEE